MSAPGQQVPRAKLRTPSLPSRPLWVLHCLRPLQAEQETWPPFLPFFLGSHTLVSSHLAPWGTGSSQISRVLSGVSGFLSGKWVGPFCCFPGGSEVKVSTSNAGGPSLIPGSGRSPGEGNGNPLQYSCLENPMDGEAWWATVHGVAKSRTRLSDFTHTYLLMESDGEGNGNPLQHPCLENPLNGGTWPAIVHGVAKIQA